MNRPKLLQVTPYYPPDYTFGGPVRLVAELSERLVAQAQVTVMTYQHSKVVHVDADGLTVERYQPWSRTLARKYNIYGSFGLQTDLKRLIPQQQLVHTHDYRSFHNFTVAKTCYQHNIPLVMSSYKSISPATGNAKMKYWFDRLGGTQVLQAVSHFIAVNHFEVEDLLAYGIPEEKITVIPNATNVPNVSANPGAFRAKYHIQPHQPLILFYSRLHSYKRPDLVVAALPAILQQLPEAVLVLYGPDHGALTSLQQQIQQLGVTNSVRVISATANGQDHNAYAAADLLVLPSPHNEFPLVLLEAMGHGVPIVTCERSIESYIHERCGLVTTPTAEAIARACTQILTQSELAKQYRAQARLIYEQHFTFDQYVKRLWALYQRYITPAAQL